MRQFKLLGSKTSKQQIKQSKRPLLVCIIAVLTVFVSTTGVYDYLDVTYINKFHFKPILESRNVRIIDGDTIALENGIRIRLKGIDAPEMKQECKSYNGRERYNRLNRLVGSININSSKTESIKSNINQNREDKDDAKIKCGIKAKEKLEELARGKTVKCTDEGIDIYKRQLSYCYTINQDSDKNYANNTTSSSILYNNKYRTDLKSDNNINLINLNLELIRLGYAYSYRHQNIFLTLHELKARYLKQGLWQTDFQAPWEWRKNNKRKEK